MTQDLSVIICAGGKGTRTGFEKNKILIPVLGITPLERCLEIFSEFNFEIIVSANCDDFEEINKLAKKYSATTVLGGDTRSKSVYNALKNCTKKYVLIHDGARPFVSRETVENCIESVITYGSGICAIPTTDTVAIAKNGIIEEYPQRENTYLIQTPQGFEKDKLLRAYESAFNLGDNDFTDDSSLYKKYVGDVKICSGNTENKKLTYAKDFYTETSRCGFGVDTHAFGKEQNYITLCGVKIPCESGLIAHSDGDVALHAVMDAMLSGAGLYDIGHYFPDSDEKYKNANSVLLTEEVKKIIKEQGFAVKNISIAIQAEKPKLFKYIGEMKKTVAKVLEIDEENVGITAGTNEKLGYVGEGKGITVYAYTLLYKIINK